MKYQINTNQQQSKSCKVQQCTNLEKKSAKIYPNTALIKWMPFITPQSHPPPYKTLAGLEQPSQPYVQQGFWLSFDLTQTKEWMS